MSRIKEGVAKRARDEDKLRLYGRLRNHNKELFKDVKLYWDGGGMLFTDTKLDLPNEGITVAMKLPRFTLELTLNRAGNEEVDMNAIVDYQNGNLQANPHQALQALEVAMRTSLQRNSNWQGVKRNFFHMQGRSIPTQDGRIYKGLSHSFFPGENSLLIRSDITTTVFYETNDLVHFLKRFIIDDWAKYFRPGDEENYKKASLKAVKALKGLKFTLKYREVRAPLVVAGVEDIASCFQSFKKGERPPKAEEGEE